MAGIGSSIAKVGGALSLGAVAGGIAVLGNMAAKAFELGSSLTEAAAKVGITVEALQEMHFAATQNGIAVETMDGSLNKMTKTLGELALGNETVAKSFTELGLSARDFIGLTPTESFAKIADALKNVENESVRAALGNKIFGRSYAELKPLVDLGADGINAAAEEKRKDGVISTEQAKTLDDLADGWDRLKEKLTVATGMFIANQVASKNAGVGLSNLGSDVIKLVDAYNSASNAIDRFLRKIDVYDARASKTIAERLKESPLTGWIPGVQAAADKEINRQNVRIQQATSAVSTGRVKGTGRLVKPSGSAKPAASEASAYVPRAGSGGASQKAIMPKLTEAQIALEKFENTATSLVDRLFPEVKNLVDYKADQSSLAKWASMGKISADQLSEALVRLRDTYFGVDGPQTVMKDESFVDNITDSLPDLATVAGETAAKVRRSTEEMAVAFASNTQAILGSISTLANSIKGGGFLGILQGVAGLFLNLGGAGVFGKGISTAINSLGNFPGLARGGNATSGRTYLVGERGPELFTPNRTGNITPNNEINSGAGRATTVQIIPSRYFDAVVDSRADRSVAGASPGIASAAAAGVQTNLQQANYRTLP